MSASKNLNPKERFIMAERLYRSRSKKIIGGVAGGLADYLNLDPVLIRVIFVIITLINGLGILLYIILWIVVQEEPYKTFSYEMGSGSETAQSDNKQNAESPKQSTHHQQSTDHPNGKGRIIVGVILIALGFIFLAENWFPHFDFYDVLPLALVAGGIYLVMNSLNKKENKQ
ncbi:MAG: PspC domain-containing protein [Ignavibacteriales bacterium]|jgi:phage shock protein PspC (stress-responsive transcriptional regulator)|nr:MAG: PspC domain-containing protein [Ignavibacteriales bacterium]